MPRTLLYFELYIFLEAVPLQMFKVDLLNTWVDNRTLKRALTIALPAQVQWFMHEEVWMKKFE